MGPKELTTLWANIDHPHVHTFFICELKYQVYNILKYV